MLLTERSAIRMAERWANAINQLKPSVVALTPTAGCCEQRDKRCKIRMARQQPVDCAVHTT